VREIAEAGPIEPVPRSPALITGLAEVRGRMTTVIELGPLVGVSAEPVATTGTRLLILAEPHDHLAVRTGGEINLMELELEEIDATYRVDSAEDVFEARASLAGSSVHLLSAEKILAACEKEVLNAFRKPEASS